MLSSLLGALTGSSYDSTSAYTRHLSRTRWKFRKDRDLAFAKAIGSETVALFQDQGDAQVTVLRAHGLEDGQSIYDLGCGCGRTAQALYRSGWTGHYTGADIVVGLVEELRRKCPGYTGVVHRRPSIVAPDNSLDLLFHWSVFTHISPEECFLYLEDTFRALKPGGRLVFSFLELTNDEHYERIFANRLVWLRKQRKLPLLDAYLHRDWIELWAQKIGFEGLRFTHGYDAETHRPMWQTLASMTKPA